VTPAGTFGAGRVTLRRCETVTNDFGEAIPQWRDLAIVWAGKQDIRDSERIAAMEVGSTVTGRFQIRWSRRWLDLTPRDRLVFEGREFDITAIKEIGRREGIEITAAARTD